MFFLLGKIMVYNICNGMFEILCGNNHQIQTYVYVRCIVSAFFEQIYINLYFCTIFSDRISSQSVNVRTVYMYMYVFNFMRTQLLYVTDCSTQFTYPDHSLLERLSMFRFI